ncbi:MAG TPA: urease accessory protein UreD, partial [Chthoniobacteraceae bacterium]|nr:urease accessory protein UreD [Chthoniobacteraceae bacterium]
MSSARAHDGAAQLHVGSVAGRSAVIRSQAGTPLRLLTPRSRGEMVWAYTSSFGGGMVAGDCTRLDVTVDAGARCFLSTQASTKIYRNPTNLPCSHELVAKVGAEAVLMVAPDPVQCFADSSYAQNQRFILAPTANLLFIDWMSAGRAACGERWAFQRYVSRVEVERGGRKLLLDAIRFDAEDGPLEAKFRGGRFNCFATVAMFGPTLTVYAQQTLTAIGAQPIAPRSNVVSSAGPLHEGALLRFAGTSVEEVGKAIQNQLA